LLHVLTPRNRLYFNPSTELPLLGAAIRPQFVEKDGRRVKISVSTSKKGSSIRRMELINECIPKLASLCADGETLDTLIRDTNGSRIVYEAILEMNRYALLEDYDSFDSSRADEKDEDGPAADGQQRSEEEPEIDSVGQKQRSRRTAANDTSARRPRTEESGRPPSVAMEVEGGGGDSDGDAPKSSTRDEKIRADLKKTVHEIFQILSDKCKQLPLQSDENHLLQHRIAQYVIRRLILHLQPRDFFVATLAESFSGVVPQIVECNRSAFILNALIQNSDGGVRSKLMKLLSSKQVRLQLAQCAVNVKGAAVLNKLVSSSV